MDNDNPHQGGINLEDLLPDQELVECEDLYAKAFRLYEQDKVSKAVAVLTGIIKRNPQFGKAYFLLGRIHEWKYRNYELAEKYFLAAIKASPRFRFGYSDYFNFLRNRNRFAEARQYIEHWATLGIEDESVAYEHALLLEMQGDIKQALHYYQKAATLAVDYTNCNNRFNDIERCKRKLGMLESDDI